MENRLQVFARMAGFQIQKVLVRLERASTKFLGDVDGPPVEIALTLPGNVRWVDASHYLAIRSGKLIWGDLNGATVTIDSVRHGF